MSYLSERLPKPNYNPIRTKKINRQHVQSVESVRRDNSFINDSFSTQENLKKAKSGLPKINKENNFSQNDNSRIRYSENQNLNYLKSSVK